MTTLTAEEILANLCRDYADGCISHRELFGQAARLSVGGLSGAALLAGASPCAAKAHVGSARLDRPIATAEQGRFQVGSKPASTHGDSVESGGQMSVWYQIEVV